MLEIARHLCYTLTGRTVREREKREDLIASAASCRNGAAVASDAPSDIPEEAPDEPANHPIEIPARDGYEQSILRKTADEVKIAVRGGTVDMSAEKRFA